MDMERHDVIKWLQNFTYTLFSLIRFSFIIICTLYTVKGFYAGLFIIIHTWYLPLYEAHQTPYAFIINEIYCNRYLGGGSKVNMSI